jgi:hypothetical protein
VFRPPFAVSFTSIAAVAEPPQSGHEHLPRCDERPRLPRSPEPPFRLARL